MQSTCTSKGYNMQSTRTSKGYQSSIEVAPSASKRQVAQAPQAQAHSGKSGNDMATMFLSRQRQQQQRKQQPNSLDAFGNKRKRGSSVGGRGGDGSTRDIGSQWQSASARLETIIGNITSRSGQQERALSIKIRPLSASASTPLHPHAPITLTLAQPRLEYDIDNQYSASVHGLVIANADAISNASATNHANDDSAAVAIAIAAPLRLRFPRPLYPLHPLQLHTHSKSVRLPQSLRDPFSLPNLVC
jgi:hypothetical protein